jgi:arylsulfatase A
MRRRKKMNMTHRLWIALVLTAVMLSGTGAAAAERPPNVVLVLADDLGWADLGCYGNTFNETPRIDKLATQGLRFTDCYAYPVCSPTRAAIQTGQNPARLGLTAHIPGHWRPFEKLAEPPIALDLPRDVATVAERLHAAGYATGYFGKWHLGSPGPGRRGYDEAFESQGHAVPGPRQEPPARQPRRAAEYLAERAVKFITTHRDKPFFVQVSPFAVHIPLSTTPALEAKYQAKPKVPGYASNALYAGLLEELDTCVGTVLDALDKNGLSENTLFIFLSDNGGLEREVGGWPGTTNAPLRNEKGTLYEGGIRVPMIVRWPGMTRPGTVTHVPAFAADFFPTALAAAHAPPASQALDSVSLLPVLRDPAATLPREALYWHYPHYHHSRPSGATRAGDWKAIEFFDTGAVELYNLRDDLGESKDLAASQPEKARELREKLHRWRLSVDAQMPLRNPAYDPKRAGEWWSRVTIAPTEAPGTYRPARP